MPTQQVCVGAAVLLMTCKLQQPPHNCDWPQVTDFKETFCSLSHSSTLSSAECFKMLTLTVCNTQIRSICMFYMYHQHFHNVEHNNHITCTANEPTPGVFTWATRPRCSLPVSNSYCIKIWENFFVATKLQILNEML